MKQIKVFVVGDMSRYITSFIKHNFIYVDNIEDANVIIFTGGEDVDPSLYHSERHKTTYSNINRDIFELKQFDKAMQSTNKPLIIGICRGSQFLTVVNGGKLIQNVENHCRSHMVHTSDGRDFMVTSTHHQMHYPFDLPSKSYRIMAWAKTKLSSIYEGDNIDPEKVFVEPEIVYFPKTRCLCIQGHPEMCNTTDPFVGYVNKLIKKFFKNKL